MFATQCYELPGDVGVTFSVTPHAPLTFLCQFTSFLLAVPICYFDFLFLLHPHFCLWALSPSNASHMLTAWDEAPLLRGAFAMSAAQPCIYPSSPTVSGV